MFFIVFFVAIARAVVNHDDGGGTAPHPLVWSAGSLPKRRDIVDAVRNFAFLPGPACLWSGEWVSRMSGFGLVLFLFWLRFLPFWAPCIGRLPLMILVLGVSHSLSYLFCMSFGLVNGFLLRKLFLSVGGSGVQFQCRLFLLVQALIFGVLVGFFGAIFRALSLLPGGLGRFLPGRIGANHCRLRHIGWDKCGHGLTSRPRETSSVWFLDELLVLFGYPSAYGASLLAGTLPLRFFSESFACRVPTWRLPEGGNVPSFLASRGLVWGGPNALSTALGRAGVYLGSGSGGGAKRVRLYRKTSTPC